MKPVMSWNKTVYSIILWAAYLLGSSAALLCSVYYLAIDKVGYDKSGYDRIAVVVAVSFLIFIIGMVFILKGIEGKVRGKLQNRSGSSERYAGHKERVSAVLEGVCFVLLMALGAILRMNAFPEMNEQDLYFQMALIEEGKVLSYPDNGLHAAYLYLLHILFYTIGNRWIAGIWLQFILQFLGAVIMYAAIRKLSGRFSAVLLFCIQMIMPCLVQSHVGYSPVFLFQFVYACAFYATACCLESHADEQRQRRSWFAGAIAAMLLALICWMNIAGLTLVPLVFSIARIQIRERYGNAVRVIGKIMLMFSLFLAVISGIFLLYSDISGSSFLPYLEAWLLQYNVTEVNVLWFIERNRYAPVLLAGMVYTGVLYWMQDKKDRISPWFGILLSCWMIGSLQMNVSNEVIYCLTMSYTFLIGIIGIRETFRRKQEEETVKMECDIIKEENQSQKDVQSTEEKKEVKQIANPLPLPKKSVRKAAEYALEVSEELMHFDIDVDENDDYDRKE